jgi:hypothetical protein
MSRLFRRRPGVLARLAFVAMLIGGFSLGLLSARRTQARADGGSELGYLDISQKHWISA